jgi:hypothetical protein
LVLYGKFFDKFHLHTVQTPLEVGQQLNVTIGGYGALRMSKFTFASRIARLSALA